MSLKNPFRRFSFDAHVARVLRLKNAEKGRIYAVSTLIFEAMPDTMFNDEDIARVAISVLDERDPELAAIVRLRR